MTQNSDTDAMLRALVEMRSSSTNRPSMRQAQISNFPDWDNDRLIDLAIAMEKAGLIHDPINAMLHVTLTSKALDRVRELDAPPPAQNINVGIAQNSPIQQLSGSGSAVQNVSYNWTTQDLRKIVDTYYEHVDELNLNASERKRADALVSAIDAELDGDPDPSLIQSLGKSLKSIIEGAIGSGLGSVATNPATWTTLMLLF